MSENKLRQQYKYQFLQEYCKEKNISLLKDYNNKINRNTIIEANCLNKDCKNTVEKKFRSFIETGCFCDKHTKENGFLKIKKSDWSNSNKVRYNNKYLNSYCEENSIILLKDYNNTILNRESIIEANCLNKDCENIVEKTFRNFIETGCFCHKHTKENGFLKIKNSDWSNSNKIRYNNKYLNNYCEVNNISLLKDYNNTILNRESIIEANCLNKDCENIVEKTFRMIIDYGGCYCNNCTELNKMNKIKQTNLEKYGCEYAQQNSEVSEKTSINAYKSYDYIFPSGRIERIQGYEKYMLNELLEKEEIIEDDIIVKRSEVPIIWYEDKNGKKRRYFVDCFIKSQNRCIEVKSTWTANKKQDCIYLKQQALKNAGYKCEIWIYNKKELIQKIL
jgi:hypothetical protein